jgi:transcriptional regulator with XRE-family HTH domain
MYNIDLKSIRRQLRMSQKDFATAMQVSQPYISEIEKGKRPVSDLIVDNIKDYADAHDLQLDFASEPLPDVYIPKKNRYQELDEFVTSDLIYRVPESNAIGEYRAGLLLAMKKVTNLDGLIIGMPYMIVTATDEIEIIRYILGIDKSKKTITIAWDLDGRFAQDFPMSEISQIFTIKSYFSQKL